MKSLCGVIRDAVFNTTKASAFHIRNAQSQYPLNARITAFWFVAFFPSFIFFIANMHIMRIVYVSNHSKLDCDAELVVHLSSRGPYFCKKENMQSENVE